jgi:ubiquinol-cytochrome c reductase iron-sulfur subunit
MADTTARDHHQADDHATRRDFLYLVAGATVGVGAAVTIWPLVDSMNPSADVLALASIDIDLSGVEEGMAITLKWRGKPVFVRHRTPAEIEEARAVDLGELRDPEPDEARAQRPQWLIMVGVCTHLGCVPLGQRPTDPKGDYGGWFCPCHGSHYDTAGRIRRGPAPLNLAVPEYTFVDDSTVRVG